MYAHVLSASEYIVIGGILDDRDDRRDPEQNYQIISISSLRNPRLVQTFNGSFDSGVDVVTNKNGTDIVLSATIESPGVIFREKIIAISIRDKILIHTVVINEAYVHRIFFNRNPHINQITFKYSPVQRGEFNSNYAERTPTYMIINYDNETKLSTATMPVITNPVHTLEELGVQGALFNGPCVKSIMLSKYGFDKKDVFLEFPVAPPSAPTLLGGIVREHANSGVFAIERPYNGMRVSDPNARVDLYLPLKKQWLTIKNANGYTHGTYFIGDKFIVPEYDELAVTINGPLKTGFNRIYDVQTGDMIICEVGKYDKIIGFDNNLVIVFEYSEDQRPRIISRELITGEKKVLYQPDRYWNFAYCFVTDKNINKCKSYETVQFSPFENKETP